MSDKIQLTKPLELLKSRMMKFKGVIAEVDDICEEITIKIPSNLGYFTLRDITPEEAHAIMFNSRGCGFDYCPEKTIESLAEMKGHTLTLEKKDEQD